MKKLRCLVILVLIATMLGGCFGAKEIEHLTYVNTLGVDYVKGKIIFYTQIISFFNIAKQEAGGTRQHQSIAIGKGIGDTVDQAIFNLYATSHQRLVWSHVKAIVFSEAALKQDVINQVLDLTDRYYEFRYAIWTFATKEPLEEVLFNQPYLSSSVLYSQLNDPMAIYNQSSVISPIYLYKFIWKWKENGQTLLLPYMAIDPNNWTQDKKNYPQLYMAGVCFLQNKTFKGCLPRSHLMGLRWLEKKTARTALTIKNKGAFVAISVLENIRPTITPHVVNGKASFDIHLSVEGGVTQYLHVTTEDDLKKWIRQAIAEEIRRTYQEGLKLKVDALQLSNALYRKYPKEWHRLTVNRELPLDENSIKSIKVQVKLLGGNLSKLREHK